VRCLCDQDLAPGDASFTWDGRDARGRPAPSGIYWAQAEAPGAKRSVRILRLR
jgi:flagellar hook assembly protein FlgD